MNSFSSIFFLIILNVIFAVATIFLIYSGHGHVSIISIMFGVVLTLVWKILEKNNKIEQILNQRFHADFIEEEDIIEYYRRIKSNAFERCYLTWCAKFPEDEDGLKKYFNDEIGLYKNKSLKLYRIINVGDNYVKNEEYKIHLDITKPYIEKQYFVERGTIKDIEIAYADYKKGKDRGHRAMIVFSDNRTNFVRRGIYFDSRTSIHNENICLTIKSMFENQWNDCPENKFKL